MPQPTAARQATDRAATGFADKRVRRRAQLGQRRQIASAEFLRLRRLGVKLNTPTYDPLWFQIDPCRERRIAVNDVPLGVHDINRPAALIEQFRKRIGDSLGARHDSNPDRVQTPACAMDTRFASRQLNRKRTAAGLIA